MQYLEREVALEACPSISGTVRNSETITEVLFLMLNHKNRHMCKQECIKCLI